VNSNKSRRAPLLPIEARENSENKLQLERILSRMKALEQHEEIQIGQKEGSDDQGVSDVLMGSSICTSCPESIPAH